MSTLRATNIKHELSATNQIVLGSDGSIGGTLGDALAAKLDTSAYSPGLSLVSHDTYSAVSSVSVDACFTSTYDNYCVLVRATPSTTLYLNARLRASSTDSTTGYSWQYLAANGTSISGNYYGSSTFWQITTNKNNPHSAVLDVFSPAVAETTMGIGRNYSLAQEFYQVGGSHSSASAFDGITIYANTGTITGSISIYGYAKA